MENIDLETLIKARAAIEEIIAERYSGLTRVPYFAPTDIGGFPAPVQIAELKIKEEAEYGNRVRSAIHMCLTASAVAMQVAETLMKNFATVEPARRHKFLKVCAEDVAAAADLSRHTARLLSGEGPAEMETMPGALY
ncbi:MAG: hypothetical protein EOO22_00880 [Comamonadaceae bacterium]|nr:MAG: hypothetical protein EOO22_00880 [Comamonadaceae bacterium]